MAFQTSVRLLVLFFATFAAGNAFGSTVLPTGSGPFNSTLHITELVDSNRVDPYNSTHLRRIMISRFDPVLPRDCGHTQLVPYFPPIVATAEDAILEPLDYPTGLWGQLQLQVCSGTHSDRDDKYKAAKFPLVLFSPGLNTTRLWYSILAQEIASRGYTVVAVDHPYDADVVLFPDGTVAYGGAVTKPTNGSTASVEQALEVRTADIAFVMDTLGVGADVPVLMFGQSFGGAASATAMLHDGRIRGGVNLDGTMFGPVLTQGFHHPLKNPPSPQGQSFILWGTQGHNATSGSDEAWAQFWATIGAEGVDGIAWKRELSLKDGFHGSFWDLNVLVDVLGIRDGLSDLAQLLVSPVKGAKAYEIAGVYLSAFFEQVLTGKREAILETDSSRYPEVVILH